jgi:hypothetical protein
MPLMQPEKKLSNEHLKLKLPSDSLQELRAYGRFLNNSSLSYVVTQLITTLGRDKEFQQWKLGYQSQAQTSALPFDGNGATQKE